METFQPYAMRPAGQTMMESAVLDSTTIIVEQASVSWAIALLKASHGCVCATCLPRLNARERPVYVLSDVSVYFLSHVFVGASCTPVIPIFCQILSFIEKSY